VVVRKRLDLRGSALVFVTTTAHEWTPVFSDDECASAVVTQLQNALTHFDVSLVGYVLMPTHLHMLLGFRKIEKLSRFMQSFKILSSKSVAAIMPDSFSHSLRVDGRFRLWKPRFDDVIITSEKQFLIKLDYIHNNPVKAGLVASASDWRCSSAAAWERDERGLLPIEKRYAWAR
jgi:putative transposase